MISRKILVAIVIAFIVSLHANAWDAAGRMIIDEIAWTQMKPSARAAATDLVHKLEAKFNADHPYNFTTAGPWLDDMRGLEHEYHWGKFHYIDIPWTPTGVEMTLPSAPHLLSGTDDSLKALRDPATPPDRRAEALGMLIHYVGDVHAPLHVTERNYDRGGNTYLIAGVPFSDLMPRQTSNLHTFWAKAYRFDAVEGRVAETWIAPPLTDRPGAPGEGIIAAQARKLMTEFPREKLPELATAGDPAAWAQQTHTVACLHAYPAGNPPDKTEIRALEPAFVHESHEIANRQLALAGYRLGDLLNSLFAP